MHRIKPMLNAPESGCGRHLKGLPFKASSPKRLRIQSMLISGAAQPRPLTGFWQHAWLFFSRVAQSFRLMVGVRDYQAYLIHMQSQHPGQQPMTERQFHRYCVDARYGSKAGKLGKCPC